MTNEIRAVYQDYRERVVNEDGWLNHRITWLLLVNAALAAMWAAQVSRNGGGWPSPSAGALNSGDYLFFACCGLGALTSILAMVSTLAAHAEISYWEDRFRDFLEDVSEDQKKWMPESLIGTRYNHFWGHIFTSFVPPLFLLLWIGIASMSFISIFWPAP